MAPRADQETNRRPISLQASDLAEAAHGKLSARFRFVWRSNLHGYAIAARLEQVSGGALQLNMGTLYPALMRLEQRGLLRGNWGITETNRKARCYAATSAGRRQLAREKDAWDRMAGIIHTLLPWRRPRCSSLIGAG